MYLYVSKEKNIKLANTYIKDPYDHRLSLDNEGIIFNRINLNKELTNKEEVISYINENSNNILKESKIYKVVNYDGEYYSVDPELNDDGNYGISFYPKTDKRKESGYIVTERFFLNPLFKYKNKFGLNSIDKFLDASWDDVNNVIEDLKEVSKRYEKENKSLKSKYIDNQILPMIITYTNALKKLDILLLNSLIRILLLILV